MSCQRRSGSSRVNARPLSTPRDALGLVLDVIDRPPRQELVVLLSRAGLTGGVSLVIDRAPDPDSVLVVFDLLAGELGPGDVVAFGTVRPKGPVEVGPLEAFVHAELLERCDEVGVELMSWHIVDGSTAVQVDDC